jgi:hypothetical protein
VNGWGDGVNATFWECSIKCVKLVRDGLYLFFCPDTKEPKSQGCGNFCEELFNLPKLHKLAPFSRSDSAQFFNGSLPNLFFAKIPKAV